MDIFYIKIKENHFNSGHEAGRYIIEYAAKNFYNIKNAEIEIINKKPKFLYSDLKFSISHSKEIAAVCFDTNETGFDIEKINPRDYKSIAQRMKFVLEEDTLEAFYKCWTLYEAEYKLQKEAKYTFTSLLEKNYMMSIASADETNIKSNLRIQKIAV